MKVSKKEIAKAMKKEQARSAGHVANNLETEAERQEQAMKKIQNNPDLLKVIKRMKDR